MWVNKYLDTHIAMRSFSGKKTFEKNRGRMVTPIEVEKAEPTRNRFKNARKRLINRERGLGFEVEAGLSWRRIAMEVLNDGTHSSNLIKVAKGEIQSTNGWEVEILED